jgi:hypothetical protein
MGGSFSLRLCGGKALCALLLLANFSSLLGSENNHVKRYRRILLYGTDEGDDDFGESLALVGDTNGDDVPDIAVGAPDYVSYNEEVGMLTLFHMKSSGLWHGYNFFYGDDFGLKPGSYFGASVAAVRDLNNNSRFELAVGAPEANKIVLLFMEKDGDAQNFTVLNASTAYLGEIEGGKFGAALASGTFVNATSYDLISGDPYGNNGDGILYFMRLTAAGLIEENWNISAAQVGLADEGAFYGASIAVLPDLDGDLENEIVVGAPKYDSMSGGVLLLFMEIGAKAIKSFVLIEQSDISRWVQSMSCCNAALTKLSYVLAQHTGYQCQIRLVNHLSSEGK